MSNIKRILFAFFGLTMSCVSSLLGSYIVAMLMTSQYKLLLEGSSLPVDYGSGTVILSSIMSLYITVPTYGLLCWKAKKSHAICLLYALLFSVIFALAVCTWEYFDVMV